MLDVTRIQHLPLFRGLSVASLSLLAQHGIERRYSAGETLFHAGDSPWGVYVVLEGRVRVVRGQGGRNVVIHTEGAGGTLADVPFFAGGVLPGTGVASEPTTCAIFPRDALRAVIQASPDVAFALLERLAVRVRDLVERLDQISSNSVAARLAAHLLRRCHEHGALVVSLGMTQTQLAEELGTVREVVVRELRALRTEAIIAPARAGWFEVLDVDRLAKIAGPQPRTT